MFDVMEVLGRTHESYPESFMMVSLLKVCQEWMGGPLCWYLEDIEGYLQETWRTGSSLTSWMYLVDPKDHILNDLC